MTIAEFGEVNGNFVTMTIYRPEVAEHAGPKYQAIADAIADDIASGRLAPASRLPPQRDLAYALGVTVGTVGRAYAEIARLGLVRGEVGRGTFVRGGDGDAIAADPAPPRDSLVDLGRNGPSSGPHAQALRSTLAAILRDGDAALLLDYAPETGLPQHRAAGARWMSRVGLSREPAQVLATAGAQHALALTLAALARADEPVLLEALTYYQLTEPVALLQRRPVPVALDDQGAVPQALDEAAARSGARLCFLVPTLQNPTVATMPLARREAIVAVARRRDLILIEDDVYGYLPVERPPPLAGLAPERVVYLTSVSKSLAPGLRAGWISAPPDLLRRLADAQRALDVAQPPMPAEIAARWIASGEADSLLAWQRAEAAARHRIAEQALAGLPVRADPAGFHAFLDLPPPWTATGFAAAARERGVQVLPAEAFTVADARPPAAVRLSLSNASDRLALGRALDLLARLAREAPPRGGAII